MIETEEQARNYVQGLCEQSAFERLDRFAELLLEENQLQNLISKASEEQVWQRHFADSAQLLAHVPRETLSEGCDPWLDLGTGAGPPGLVIAILRPDLPVRLVESRGRRVDFLCRCVDQLSLSNCDVIGERLERVEPFPASVISARAFAPLEKLLRLSSPFSTKRTRYLLPKGRSAAHELKQQKSAIRKMFHVEQSLTDCEAGIIVSV
ncbi:16S rRNA (guanine(527)-N(7))-methyltransferase RsmG [Erythrobacter sp. WH158]|uniref:Ribosomal RNA small subunit methyltransferase G n=1 Tax=Erythrobacter crassostreae TaxID=2828328 RepID=A0A9X1JK46_9SPHN|nr:16S rRNA (guanine(527)-N(7))-methyltransferase RsmG [Erythrobacter crassostrea]MBV7258566.1 16S rRNA (guanine(527)-N(7))-methyltransferase RsmG [Erythrobacter crassostrea]